MSNENVIDLSHLIVLPPAPDNKTKHRARRIAYKAYRAGEIIKKPCAVCGTTNLKLHMHHEDYSKPLEIVWLCYYHHQLRHVELNEQLRKEIDRQVAAIRF